MLGFTDYTTYSFWGKPKPSSLKMNKNLITIPENDYNLAEIVLQKQMLLISQTTAYFSHTIFLGKCENLQKISKRISISLNTDHLLCVHFTQ